MRFLRGFIVGSLGCMLLWFLALWLQIGRPTESSQWIADAYTMKEAAAARIHGGPRLLIVAGSAALFGIDSEMLEARYGLPTVNLGVNAGLLLPYVLLKSQKVLRPGDIVLLPLEYHFFSYDGNPNTQMIDQIWARDPLFFKQLGLMEQLRLLWQTPVSRIVDGLFAVSGKQAMCGPYGYKNIDGRGDQLHTSRAEAEAWASDWENTMRELPRKHGLEARPDNGLAWRWLARYAEWARKRNIHLIALPSTMLFQEFYRTDPVEQKFYQGLPERMRALGIPYAGDPYDFMYAQEWYFNTDYHLIDTGRTMNTERIIDTLGPDLQTWFR